MEALVLTAGLSPMKINFVMFGKTRRKEFQSLFNDYAERISHYAEIKVSEIREDSAGAWRKLKMDPAAVVVLLDAEGKQFTSEQFARWIEDLRDRGTREIVFLCGDAEGYPNEMRTAGSRKVSLSTLTMPHEFARVILAEQVYRAFSILAGHPYSK